MSAPAGTKRAATWILIGGVVLVTILIVAVPSIVRLVVIAVLLAYILDPIVTRMELRGMSRTFGTVLLFVILSATLFILFATLMPIVAAQLQSLAAGTSSTQTSTLIKRIEHFIRTDLGFLGFRDFNLTEKIHQLGAYAGERAIDFLLHDMSSFLMSLVAIPIIMFFVLKDGREIKRWVISMVPNRYFEFSLDLLYKMDLQLGGYLRSQFLDALVFGALSTILLWILGVNYFLVIGVFAGFANLIPYIGPLAGALPAIAVSLVDSGDLAKCLQIVVGFAVLKVIDDAIVQPMLVARGADLPPLAVFLAILVGGELFGILGMLLAVPCTGFLKVVLQESIETLRKYRLT